MFISNHKLILDKFKYMSLYILVVEKQCTNILHKVILINFYNFICYSISIYINP